MKIDALKILAFVPVVALLSLGSSARLAQPTIITKAVPGRLF